VADFKPAQVTGDLGVTGAVTINGISLSTVKTTGAASNVAATTLTTILTKVADALFSNITIISVSGEVYARYILYINSNLLDVRRTGPDRNLQFDYTGSPLALTVGDVVDIKVEHYNTGDLADFDATIYGYA
jgi:hypothetical protein